MNTIQIGTYAMPITEDLEQKFLEYYAYYSMPARLRSRVDPRAKQYQWLYDDYRSALYHAWIEFLDSQNITDQEFDDLEELLGQQDPDHIIDQLEATLEPAE